MQYSTLILDVLHFLLTPFNVIHFEFFPTCKFQAIVLRFDSVCQTVCTVYTECRSKCSKMNATNNRKKKLNEKY